MFRQLKTNEVALLLHGLRAVTVVDEQAAHDKLTRMLEGELAARGCSLGDGNGRAVSHVVQAA